MRREGAASRARDSGCPGGSRADLVTAWKKAGMSPGTQVPGPSATAVSEHVATVHINRAHAHTHVYAGEDTVHIWTQPECVHDTGARTCEHRVRVECLQVLSPGTGMCGIQALGWSDKGWWDLGCGCGGAPSLPPRSLPVADPVSKSGGGPLHGLVTLGSARHCASISSVKMAFGAWRGHGHAWTTCVQA